MVTAAAPSLLVPAVTVVALCGVLLGRRGRTVWWALLPSLALFVPFAFSVLDRPRAMLADPGMPLGFDAAPLWQQALGQPLRFDADGGLTGLAVFAGSAAGPAAGAGTAVPWALLLALLLRAAGAAAGPCRAVPAAPARYRDRIPGGTLPVGRGAPHAGGRLACRPRRHRRQRRCPGHAVHRPRRVRGRRSRCSEPP